MSLFMTHTSMLGLYWQNLQEITAFYQKLDENIPLYDDNFYNPTYRDYHEVSFKNIFITAKNIVTSLFGNKISISWPKDEFNTLLKHATEIQQKKLTTIYDQQAKTGQHYIVLGDTHGAFHSLTRMLNFLKEFSIKNKVSVQDNPVQAKPVIDNDLNLDPHYSLVFLGDTISHGAYSLETLGIIFQLIIKNPDQIIYIRGPHETDNFWKNFSLAQEIGIKITRDDQKQKVFMNALSTFFNLLKDRFTLNYTTRHNQQAQILFSNEGYNSFNEPPTPHITTQIKAENPVITYRLTSGLRLSAPEKGITTWALFSSPILPHKKYYDFHNDSFAVLDTAGTGTDWTLHHYYQNPQKHTDFKHNIHNFMTCQTLDTVPHLQTQPVALLAAIKNAKCDHTDELLIGTPLSLTGSNKHIGRATKVGLFLRLNKENIRYGGINGRFLRLVFLDDGYQPPKTHKCVQQLFKTFKTNLIVNPTGTPTFKVALPLIQQYNMTALFPYTGGTFFRNASTKNVISTRVSYADEATALVNYAVQKLHIKKFAIFYQNDSYGYPGRDAAKKVLNDTYGITNILETSYQTNTLNVEKATKDITNFAPEAILFFSSRSPSEELIRQIGILNLSKTQLFGISFLTSAFSTFVRNKGLSLTMSNIVPNPNNTLIQLVKEYANDLQTFMPEEGKDVTSLEAYLSASLLIDALQNLSPPYTTNKLTNYFEQIKNRNFKGINLNFNPETRTLMDRVWLDTGKQHYPEQAPPEQAPPEQSPPEQSSPEQASPEQASPEQDWIEVHV